MAGVRVAAVILTKNEEPRIEECLKHLRPHVDYILVIDGRSTDKTHEIAIKYVNTILMEPHKHMGNFAAIKNFARKMVPRENSWILWVDSDERFDAGFLRYIKDRIQFAEETHAVCFRFPRINLPDGKDWPDYQVRLFMNSQDIEWRGKTHEVPYLKTYDLPLDKLDEEKRGEKLYVITADRYPIVHLPRREDDKRSWW